MTASSARSFHPGESRQETSQSPQSVESVTAVDRAALIQRQFDRQELHCSLIALGAKVGLILLGCVSVARLSVAYQERLESLQSGFDRLFTLGGEKRLLENQDQWIAPNRLRVVWR